MSNDRIPEAWIGEEVAIHTLDNREFLVKLEDVRNFGFVYSLRDTEGMPLFAPWSLLRWMRPPGSDQEVMRRQELGEL